MKRRGPFSSGSSVPGPAALPSSRPARFCVTCLGTYFPRGASPPAPCKAPLAGAVFCPLPLSPFLRVTPPHPPEPPVPWADGAESLGPPDRRPHQARRRRNAAARAPARLYPARAPAAPGWAARRSSGPGSAGRRPWRAERTWLRVRRPAGAARAAAFGAQLAGNHHVGRRRQPSAEPPARDTPLARPGSPGRRGAGRPRGRAGRAFQARRRGGGGSAAPRVSGNEQVVGRAEEERGGEELEEAGRPGETPSGGRLCSGQCNPGLRLKTGLVP